MSEHRPQPVLAIGSYSPLDTGKLAEELDALAIDRPAGLAELAEETRGAVRAVAYKGSTLFGPAEMDLLPNLGIVANFGVGYDAIDVAAASARDIRVTNTPDVLNDDVADLAVGLALARFRAIAEGDVWVRSGRWASEAMPLQRKMSGRSAGILGLGNIGREIAERLAAFKMPIHYWSRAPKSTPESWTYHPTPVELARAVDVLVVIVVGGAETRHIVNAEVLDALGPDGVLVNVSRGSTVDEPALIAAIKEGRLGGAALDVYENEPSPDPRLATLERVTQHPHGGSATHETRAAMGALQRDNIRAFLADKQLPTSVNG